MGRITRRPRALRDLLDLWDTIAEDNEIAADGVLDRIGAVLEMLAENPAAGRSRPELAPSIRSFPVGKSVLFYLPVPGGIELVRVMSGYRDIGSDDVAS